MFLWTERRINRIRVSFLISRTYCCASMIMSAFLLVRNVPMRPPKGGHVEEDGDERTRTGAGGGAGANRERRAAFGGRGSADGPELPADGTGVEAIPGGRRDGLKHRSAGRRSNRAYTEKLRRKALGLVREKYGGPVGERFGPTLAVEHLASEDGVKVDGETLRRWMLAEGLWSRERRRRRHRRRRQRKEHFGEMVQMDGSFHPWLEERGPEGCL